MFTFIFLVEVVIKITGLGVLYFKFATNVFDFVITLVSVAVEVAEIVNPEISFGATSVIRVFRVGRIFKLFRELRPIGLIF